MVQNNTLNDSVLYNSVPHVHYLCQPPLESRNPAFHLQPKLVCEALSPQLFWYVKAKLQKSRFLHSFVILSWRGCYTKRGKKKKKIPALPASCFAFAVHISASFARDARAILLSINPKQDGTQSLQQRKQTVVICTTETFPDTQTLTF